MNRPVPLVLGGKVKYGISLYVRPTDPLIAASPFLMCLRGKGLPRLLAGPSVGWLVLVVIIVYWIVRNIPVFPFSVLAP